MAKADDVTAPRPVSDREDRASDATRSPALGYVASVMPAGFTRVDGDATARGESSLATEVPVALVYNGRAHAVMMCTPADLEDFAVGFSVTEGIAPSGDIRRCEVVRYSRGIELQLEIPADAAARLASRGRAIAGRTGCGLCGVEAIDDALREPPAVRSHATFQREALYAAGEALGRHQPLNDDTRTVHAAGWFPAAGPGAGAIVREDVGRHNAVDKVVGALARAGTAGADGFLVVTSRASYELVQKAAVAGIPLLAAVSRPTALAVALAQDAGITLIGLLRGRSANIHTHPARIL